MKYALTASGLESANLCPAKPRLEHGLPREDSEYSLRGTDLHRYFRTSLSRAGLPPADVELLERADSLSETFLLTFLNVAAISESDVAEEEHEIDLNGVITGHPDTVYTFKDGEVVALLDFKSGFIEVEEAPSNWQTAAYAALLWQRKPFRLCGVAIVQPNALGPKVTSAIYTAEQMPGVIAAIEAIKERVNDIESVPVAGIDQCRYCRAKYYGCHAFNEQLSIVRGAKIESMLALPAEEFARIGDAIKLGAMLSKAWSAEAVRRIEAGELPGWKLKDNGRMSQLNNLPMAYERFSQEYGHRYLSHHDRAMAFMACLSAKFGKLDELFSELENVGTKKARAKINELFAGLIEHEEKAKSPVRVS